MSKPPPSKASSTSTSTAPSTTNAKDDDAPVDPCNTWHRQGAWRECLSKYNRGLAFPLYKDDELKQFWQATLNDQRKARANDAKGEETRLSVAFSRRCFQALLMLLVKRLNKQMCSDEIAQLLSDEIVEVSIKAIHTDLNYDEFSRLPVMQDLREAVKRRRAECACSSKPKPAKSSTPF